MLNPMPATTVRTDSETYLLSYHPSLPPEALARERVLVTGASGFIGSNLLEFYRGWDAEAVANFDIAAPRNPDHRRFWHRVDICDGAGLQIAMQSFQPTVVFHLAARADLVGKTADDYPENSSGVRNVIAAMRKLPNRPRLLVASSRMVCEIRHRPTHDTDYSAPNAYGQSKVLTELVTRKECGNAIPWVLVRPTGIWGPWFDIPYRNFFEKVRHRMYLHPKGAQTRKSYGFVGNTVHQLDRLMYSGFVNARGRTLYVTDPAIQVLDWARAIAKSMGVRPPLHAPHVLLAAGAKLGDRLRTLGWHNPPLTSFRLDNLMTDMDVDYMLAEEIVGNGPYNMKDAIDITVNWLSKGYSTAQKAG
jgi:nucleoside-diphosphate-sugar epimerase